MASFFAGPSGEGAWDGMTATSSRHGALLEQAVFGGFTKDTGGLIFNRNPATPSSNRGPSAPASTPPRPNPLSPGDPMQEAPSPPPVRTGVTTVEHLGPGRIDAPAAAS